MKVTEISKVLGEKWGKMDEEAKAPYNKRAQADKERCVFNSNSFQSQMTARSNMDLVHCVTARCRSHVSHHAVRKLITLSL